MKTGNQSGFTFVEIILAIGLAALLMPALSRALSFSLKISSQGEKFTQANALASEGLEAVYYIKSHDPNWLWTDVSPASGIYQPVKSPTGTWTLGSVVTPTVSPKPYTRKITIEPVKRYSSTKMPCYDPCTDPFVENAPAYRKVTVEVSWPEPVGSQQVILESYVSQH